MFVLILPSWYGWTHRPSSRVSTRNNIGWQLGSSLEKGPFNLRSPDVMDLLASLPINVTRLFTHYCRIMESKYRGREVFIQMADDILCRKEEDESVWEAEARAEHVAQSFGNIWALTGDNIILASNGYFAILTGKLSAYKGQGWRELSLQSSKWGSMWPQTVRSWQLDRND